jgi:hypothetical protein
MHKHKPKPKTKKSRKPRNTTLKKHNSRIQHGGAIFLVSSETQRPVPNRRYPIVLAETYDDGSLSAIYIGTAKADYVVPQTCNRESCAPQRPPYRLDGKGISIIFDPIASNNTQRFTYYEGNFKNHVKSGKGKMTFYQTTGEQIQTRITIDELERMTNEEIAQLIDALKEKTITTAIYDGNWENNMMNGKGTIWVNNEYVYAGDFENNQMHGKGKMLLTNQNNYYAGAFENNKMEGMGKMEYNDKNRYLGQWHNNLRHGIGKMIFSTGYGRSYTGGWHNNMMDGFGVVEYRDGRKFEVLMQNDHPLSQPVEINKSTSVSVSV